MRGDQPVELTPKVFELLSIMVENPGRLLGKDELMDKIWADSFVEESDLTFNIRQLRKILGDDAHDPKYIKTVRMHGYCFIADVKWISQEDKPKEEYIPVVEDKPIEEIEPKEIVAPIVSQPSESTPVQQPAALPKTKNYLVPIFVASLILLVGVAVIGSWYARSRSSASNAPVLSAPFASEKLSTNGKVVHAVLSPDGKNVVYTSGKDTEKESVWVRQLDDGNNIEIIPPSDDFYAGIALSPDGSTLYFVRGSRLTVGEPAAIYRVSIFGGVPQKIVSETEGWISISPDASQVAYSERQGDERILTVASLADGQTVKTFHLADKKLILLQMVWTPDGKNLAYISADRNYGNNVLWMQPLDADSPRQIAALGDDEISGFGLAVSPDGKTFGVTQGEWLHDAFLLKGLQ